MTREELAKKVRWAWIIWLVGFVNVGAMIPQLIEIIRTGKTGGLSVSMFATYLFIQIAFSVEGYFTRNRMLMVCLALSALVNLTVISLVLYLRHLGA